MVERPHIQPTKISSGIEILSPIVSSVCAEGQRAQYAPVVMSDWHPGVHLQPITTGGKRFKNDPRSVSLYLYEAPLGTWGEKI